MSYRDSRALGCTLVLAAFVILLMLGGCARQPAPAHSWPWVWMDTTACDDGCEA